MGMDGKAETVELAFDDLAIDRDAEVPIGVQLAWALRSRIGGGRFRPGQQLPGLRELAELVGVNVNTVRAVYQRLEQEGLIDSRQGSGTFVASRPRRPSAVAAIAADAARAAHETGVEPREVAAALYVSPGARAASSNLAAEQRRLLREQISMLDRTLVEMEARYPGVAPPVTEDRDPAAPRMLDVAELERVQTQLVRRLTVVQAAIDQLDSEEVACEEEPQTAARSSGARARASTRPAPAGA
jgi:DNA-binding transcriptional regulator YhcF (GntR family)